jgi:L-threonate 2-dehydrogenase
MSLAKVGVLGLGVIGKPIAERLLAAGFQVAVFDVRAEPVAEVCKAGARACASPAEVGRASEVVLSLVANAAQTDEIVFGGNGMLEALAPGSIFITGSTLGPAAVCRVAQALAEKGCVTLDAPISGGYVAAREGRLSLMVGATRRRLRARCPCCVPVRMRSRARAKSAPGRRQSLPINSC